MDEDLEARIRRRAHELWEQDGRPLGGDTSYWLAAEREIVGIVDTIPKPRSAADGASPDEGAGQSSIASAFAPGLSPPDPRHDD